MSVSTTQGPALQKVKRQTDRRQRASHGSVIAELRARGRTEQQRDAAERLIRHLSRVQARQGDTIDRTWRQLAKGLGLATEGLTDRQCRNRYRWSIARTIDYLIDWGYVQSREAVYEANGEGRCILIRLPAGVAQSVRATRIPISRTPVRVERDQPRSSFSPEVCTPRREPLRRVGPSVVSQGRKGREAVGACAPGTRALAAMSTPVSAALEATVADLGGSERTCGAAVLRQCPALEAVPVDVVAREAWRLFGRGDPRLSLRMRERLDRASSQLERVGYVTVPPGPAASRAAAIDLALGDWELRWPKTRPPKTLGGLAVCLRRLAHEYAGKRRAAAKRRGQLA